MNLTHLETLLAAATPGPWEIAGPDKNWIWAVLSSTKMPLTWFARYYPKAFSREDTEALVALRNAAPALIARIRELEEWQPIETAPKDGARILVKDDEGEIFTANWDSGFQEWYVIGDHTSLRFTHWRSLP